MSDLEFDDDFDFDDDDDLFGAGDDFSGLVDDDDEPAPKPRAKAESSAQKQARFSAEVNKRIKTLLTAKLPSAQRREAAYWLGESGEPKAITSLVNVYRKDRNKDVRAAAEYALGQFKALDNALKGDDEDRDEAMTLLEGIVNEGKFGKRSGLNTSALLRINGALFGVFVVLLLIGLILPSGRAATPDGTIVIPTEIALGQVTPFDMDTLIADANLMWSSLNNDATLLGQQYQAVAAGQSPNCTIELTNPPAIELPASVIVDYPALVSVIDRLNAARGRLIDLQAPFNAACAEGGAAIAADVASTNAQTIVDIQRGIVDAPQLLNDPSLRFTPTPPPEPDEPTVTPSETITPTFTPTLDPATVRSHISGIRFVIDDVNGVRGANTILNQYWTDLSTAGDTDGCNRPPEEIPGAYNLPPEIALVAPELADAAENVNIGLNLLRDGWSLFRTSCIDGTLTTNLASGIAISQAATNAFNTANEILNQLSR